MKCSECLNFALEKAQRDYGKHARLPILNV